MQSTQLNIRKDDIDLSGFEFRLNHALDILGFERDAQFARHLGVSKQVLSGWRKRLISTNARDIFEEKTGFSWRWINFGEGNAMACDNAPRHRVAQCPVDFSKVANFGTAPCTAKPHYTDGVIFRRITVNVVIQTSAEVFGDNLTSYYDDDGKLLFTSKQQDELPY